MNGTKDSFWAHITAPLAIGLIGFLPAGCAVVSVADAAISTGASAVKTTAKVGGAAVSTTVKAGQGATNLVTSDNEEMPADDIDLTEMEDALLD